MGLFETYERAQSQAINDWIRNFVLVYGSAYSTARTSFMDTIKAQAEADKAARERNIGLAMFALSLCGGSVLTMVFGNAAASAVAGEVALDTICKYNMERAFKAANFISSNKTASFALGQVWDGAGGVLSDKLKSSLAETGGNFPSLPSFAQQPLNLQNKLEQWVRDAYAKVQEAEEEISKVSSEAQKTTGMTGLLASPFFRTAPKKAINEDVLAVEMELTMFLKYLLERDFYVTTTTIASGTGGAARLSSRTAINELPASGKYPTRVTTKTGNYMFETKEVEYDDVGDLIKDRVDTLCKSRFHDDFFLVDYGYVWDSKESLNRQTLLRAEWRLKMLGNANLDAIQKTLAA
jgi:hypothetical protein